MILKSCKLFTDPEYQDKTLYIRSQKNLIGRIFRHLKALSFKCLFGQNLYLFETKPTYPFVFAIFARWSLKYHHHERSASDCHFHTKFKRNRQPLTNYQIYIFIKSIFNKFALQNLESNQNTLKVKASSGSTPMQLTTWHSSSRIYNHFNWFNIWRFFHFYLITGKSRRNFSITTCQISLNQHNTNH